MRHLIAFVRPSRAVRRLFTTRRGSVLILCVVLIVVLALIGTAMLSGARVDRFTTQQHSTNTQIELLIEGAKQIAQGEIVGDLFDSQSGAFRRPAAQSQRSMLPTYDHFDAHYFDPPMGSVAANDAFIASLVPRKLPLLTNQIVWDAISGPLAGPNFESPALGPGVALRARNYMIPTARRISLPDGTSQWFPALTGDEVDPVSGAVTTVTELAADADGDGIADSRLCRLLPGELNGVTWYVAYRIVDNAAKVNVNTAFSRDHDYDNAGAALPADRTTRYFTGSVGLVEMLRTWTPTTPTSANPITGLGLEAGSLNLSRFNNLTFAAGVPNGIGNATGQQPSGGIGPLKEIDDGGPPDRSDFVFFSFADALYTGLGRRLEQPGLLEVTGPRRTPWAPFSEGDMAVLAAKFTLVDPDASKSKLEEVLADSLYDHAANGPMAARAGVRRYDPQDINRTVDSWFPANFDYDTELYAPTPVTTSFKPLRALLATHNPVANWAPLHDMDIAPPLGIGASNKVAFDQQLTQFERMPDYGGGTLARSVAKTDANTAKFGELWRAYWNVMIDQHRGDSPTGGTRVGSPFSISSSGSYSYATDTWKGNTFDATTGLPHTGPGSNHPQHMFRSSIRDIREPVALYFTPSQQLLLRAALAAVNTEDMRDPNDTPTRRTIGMVVTDDTGAGDLISAEVSVYGIERQPYITEVYVNTQNYPFGDPGGAQNPKGYVAVELYNPYPQDILITGWGMAVIDRRRSSAEPPPTPTNPYPNPSGGPGLKGLSYFYIHAGAPNTPDGALPPSGPWLFPAGTVVPAKGFLVLHNHDPAATDPDAAQVLPAGLNIPATTPTVYVPNLHWVVRDANTVIPSKEGRGGELVLLQPLSAGTDPLLTDLDTIPIDSFDFTGLLTPARYEELPTERLMTSWHYVRSNSASASVPAEPNWKFVYPGRYNGDAITLRHQGTREAIWADGSTFGDPNIGNVRLGQPDPTASYLTTHTIQLNGLDFAGPYPAVNNGTDNRYPFGGFARNGDILQVPYLGSYRVSFASADEQPPAPPTTPRSVLELSAVTMDSCFANDSDIENDERAGDTEVHSREQVGRFAPLRDRGLTGTTPEYDDLDPDGDFNRDSTALGLNKWRYRWAIDLFDHLTVQSPGNDYLPNVPTIDQPSPAYVPTRDPVQNGTFPTGGIDQPPAPPQTPGAEDAVAMHGLININTAPAKVLAAIPWLPTGDNYHYDDITDPANPVWVAGPNPGAPVEDNYELAKRIVEWRDGGGTVAAPANGPFTSVFDLYRVRAFVKLQEKLVADTAATGGPDDAHGDFSPHNNPRSGTPPTPLTDSVRLDFEEQYLLLNKVSNLITTRSDSFTVYITVQGWSNVGKPPTPPQLVAQRRVGFIIDRSRIRVQNGKPEGDPVITLIPGD